MIRWLLTILAAGLGGAASALAQQPDDLAADLIGAYHFNRPQCDSGEGFRLNADGTATFYESLAGTWRMEDGILVLRLVESNVADDLGGNAQVESEPEVVRAELVDMTPDTATFRWLSTGEVSDVYRCR